MESSCKGELKWGSLYLVEVSPRGRLHVEGKAPSEETSSCGEAPTKWVPPKKASTREVPSGGSYGRDLISIWWRSYLLGKRCHVISFLTL